MRFLNTTSNCHRLYWFPHGAGHSDAFPGRRQWAGAKKMGYISWLQMTAKRIRGSSVNAKLERWGALRKGCRLKVMVQSQLDMGASNGAGGISQVLPKPLGATRG